MSCSIRNHCSGHFNFRRDRRPLSCYYFTRNNDEYNKAVDAIEVFIHLFKLETITIFQ